jgi:sugar lactone lactonase YvrE
MSRAPRLLATTLAALAITGCPNSGSKTLIGPDQITRTSTASLVAPNSGRLVGKVKDGPVSALVGKNKYSLALAETDLVPVAGAQVEVTDEAGKAISYGPVTTDAEGNFTFRKLLPSAPVLYLRVTYKAGDAPVVMRAIALAPRSGTAEVTVDPGATFVAKKTLTLVRAKTVNSGGVDARTAQKIAAEITNALDLDTLAAAVLHDDAEAARDFDAFLNAHPDLAKAVEKLAGKSAMAHLLDPTTGTEGANGQDVHLGAAATAPSPNAGAKAGGTTLIAGNGTPGNVDGPGETARFNVPYDVASAPDGTLYVADSENNAIRKIAPDGTVSTFAGDGTPGFADGVGKEAKLNAPSGVTVAADGALIVADYGNHRIRRITPDGTVSTIAGTGAASYSDGPGATARFASPSDLTLDANGDVIVADTLNNRIRKIDMSKPDHPVTTLAGSGVQGLADGPADQAQFSTPADVAVDGKGNVYVADTGNHAIRKINLVDTGRGVTVVAGNGSAGYLDAAGPSARFNTPYGIAFGPGGVLYVADANNNSVRAIDPTGGVSTFWGTDPVDPNHPVGLFNQPSGLAMRKNAAGTVEVFVADANNHAIRKFGLSVTKSGTGDFTAK